MEVTNVGTLVENADGTMDMQYWIFDCSCCSTIDEAVQKHRTELIKLAKQAGTYKTGN